MDRLALQSTLTGLEAIEKNYESLAFHNRIIANNLQLQVDLLKKNETDLKAALDLSGHTVNDYKAQVKALRISKLQSWLISGGVSFGIGGVAGYVIARH